jgi:predicted unusual protein kinase regulating ubiquinone biosynthesis (AarF/ABC1/UbiB family)
MSISFSPKHLVRYKEILVLFLKYGNADVMKNFGVRSMLAEEDIPEVASSGAPEELAADLERMGPTFVKLGQILSSRADLLPDRYLKALARLQDKVKPFPFEQVEEIITSELGVKLSKAFPEFEREPEAAASLGQVHRARLRDGREVVVKVQRPGIRKQIADDLEVLEEIITFLEKHSATARQYQFWKVFDEFQKTLITELDYLKEQANLVQIGRNLQEFDRLLVPKPISDFCTRSILTMEYVTGVKITKIEPIQQLDLDGAALSDQLFKAYLKQVLIDGVFHADPHPGNVFLTDDKRIALLDLGMVGRTTPQMQDQLIKLLIAVSEGQGDVAVEVAVRMSQTTSRFDEEEFRRRVAGLVAENQNAQLGQIDVGRIILELGKSAGECGLYVPTELTLLGKTLLQLDEIGRTLDRNFNPTDAIRRHVTEILNRKFRKDATSGKFYSSFLDLKEFASGLPNRVNKILDVVGNSDFQVKVKADDVDLVMSAFQKIANRITMGLILAALIVGASLLMQVHTSFVLWGYPGIAMICFLVAGGAGLVLVLNIAFSDSRDKKRTERRAKQG